MKSVMNISKDEVIRVLVHIPVGALLVFLGLYVGWWLAMTFTIGFLAYELNEDKHLSDNAWKDLKGFLWGLGIGGIIGIII